MHEVLSKLRGGAAERGSATERRKSAKVGCIRSVVVAVGVLFMASAPAAIAGKNTPHDPKDFAEYSSPIHFEVPADAVYSERRGIGVQWEQGLRAGRYVARFQDDDGFYFFGDGKPICQATPRCSGFDLDGGVWVSKKRSDDVRIFLVQPPPENSQSAGILIDALVRKDIGKIFIFPANKAFAAQLASFRRDE